MSFFSFVVDKGGVAEFCNVNLIKIFLIQLWEFFQTNVFIFHNVKESKDVPNIVKRYLYPQILNTLGKFVESETEQMICVEEAECSEDCIKPFMNLMWYQMTYLLQLSSFK